MTEEEKLENRFVEEYMARCGWDMPSLDDKNADFSEYDEAVREVRWFLTLFKQAGYVQLDEQDLPKNPYEKTILPVELEKTYKEAQQDMLNQKWRKVKL